MGTLKLLTLKYSYHLKNHKMFKLLLIVALAVAVEAGYGYRGYGGYGYGRGGYGGYGYRSYGYGKREAEPGYGYRSYGYGRRYGGYRSYGYGKRSAEADASLLYAGPYNYGYAGALTYGGYAGYAGYAYGAYPYNYGYFGGLVAHPNGAVVPVDEPAVQAAKADHFAAKATAYAAAPLAVA